MCEIFLVEGNVTQFCEENTMSCFFIQHYLPLSYDPMLAPALNDLSGLCFVAIPSVLYNNMLLIDCM